MSGISLGSVLSQCGLKHFIGLTWFNMIKAVKMSNYQSSQTESRLDTEQANRRVQVVFQLLSKANFCPVRGRLHEPGNSKLDFWCFSQTCRDLG